MSHFGPPNIKKLKAKGNVKGLVKALYYKKDNTVRQSAASALDALDWNPTKDEDGARYWIEKKEWNNCIEIGSPALKPLADTLIDEKSGGLKYHLGEDDRRGIIATLGKISDPRVVDVIIATFADKTRSVQIEAVETLGHIGDDRAVKHLISLLEDGYSSEVPDAAIEALIQIGTPAVEPLIHALRNVSKFTRNRAATALGFIGDTRAAAPLITPFRDRDGYVHDAALEALIKLGRASVVPICRVLKQKDEYLRKRAVTALARIGDIQAVGPLITVLERDKDAQVREAAAEALVRISDDRAIEPLSTWLKKYKNYFPRIDVWIPEFIVKLPDVLGREPAMIHIAGLYWMSKLMFEPEREACVALGKGLIPLLEAIIRDAAVPLRDKHKAADLMGQVDETIGVDFLVTFLGHQDLNVRDAALYGLQELGWARCVGKSSKILPLLEAIVLDEEVPDDVKENAADAIGQVGETEGIAILTEILRNKDWCIRGAALHGLQTAGWEPGNDVEQALLWINCGDARRLSELDIKTIQSLLIESLGWKMAADHWHVKGKVALPLKRPGITVPESILKQAADALDEYARMYVEHLDILVNHPRLRSPEDEASPNTSVFEDYAELIAAATSGYNRMYGGVGDRGYTYKSSQSAVAALCKIKTPVSTNLLHHLSKLRDVKVAVSCEVPYSSEHPSGMADRIDRVSFKMQRDLASEDLARRGNPEYDMDVYKAEGCWRLPEK